MRSARGLGVSFLVRRARSSWVLLGCVAVTVLVTTGLAAVLWTFAGAVIPSGAQSILSAPQSRVVGLSGVGSEREAAAYSRDIRSTLRKAWPGVGFQLESALWADPIQLPQPASSTSSDTTQIQVASLAGFTAQATLTAGQWPGTPRTGDPLPVALPVAAASRLHLALGSVLTGAAPSGGPSISLRVVGFYRPDNPASPYWAIDLLPISGISVQTIAYSYAGQSTPATQTVYGPAVVSPAAFSGGLAASQSSWFVLPGAVAMARQNINALAASTSQAVSQLDIALPQGLTVTSSLPQLLTGMASTIMLARSLFTVGALLLLLVAGAGLVLAARLLASQREEESALLRARGATSWQVAQPVLAESVVLGAAACLAGVLAGSRLTGVLASLGNLSLDGYQNGGIPAVAWLSALAVLVLCAVLMTWPALRSLTPDAARLRRSRQARLAGIAWAGGDLALVALAAVAVWQLHGYSVVAHPATGSLGIDPVVAVAPALAVAGVAIIPLRGLPVLARLADKATDYQRRLAAAMVSWQIARRPIRQAGPALLVVVATATATLAVAGYASWRQSATDQAAFAVGSDVRVDAAGALSSPAGAITGAPGVTAATSASLASIGNGNQLIALDAGTADKTILLRPDLSPLPLSTLWQRITPRLPSGLALPARTDRLAIRAALGAGQDTSAAQVRDGIGSVTVTAWLQDAIGDVYSAPASGPLPADGRPHSLIFITTSSGQPASGLRLLALTMTYDLPPYDAANPSYAPNADLSIESLAMATAAGPFGRPFAAGSALTAWAPSAYSQQVPTAITPGSSAPPASYGQPPRTTGWRGAAGGAQRLTFEAGHDPSAQAESAIDLPPTTPVGNIALMAPAPQAIPAIATSGYLTANHLGVGSFATGSVSGVQITFQIVASVARFPTVFGQNRALIADFAEVNDELVAEQAIPLLQVTRWWLSTAGGQVPRLPAGQGLSVTDLASQESALLNDPLLKAPRQALLAIGVAAVLLGVLGFSVSVAASLRSRRTQSAVFAALGVGKNAQAWQLCLEQCVLSLPAAAVGLLGGIGLARLLVPAITLTAGAAPPVPSALAIVPLGPAIALALVTGAMPVAVAALTVARRPDPAAQLRVEAG